MRKLCFVTVTYFAPSGGYASSVILVVHSLVVKIDPPSWRSTYSWGGGGGGGGDRGGRSHYLGLLLLLLLLLLMVVLLRYVLIERLLELLLLGE